MSSCEPSWAPSSPAGWLGSLVGVARLRLLAGRATWVCFLTPPGGSSLGRASLEWQVGPGARNSHHLWQRAAWDPETPNAVCSNFHSFTRPPTQPTQPTRLRPPRLPTHPRWPPQLPPGAVPADHLPGGAAAGGGARLLAHRALLRGPGQAAARCAALRCGGAVLHFAGSVLRSAAARCCAVHTGPLPQSADFILRL